MHSVNTYQDILTPEEEEERRAARAEREERKREAAEMRAEYEYEEHKLREADNG